MTSLLSAAPDVADRSQSTRKIRIPVVRALRTGGPDHEIAQADVKAAASSQFPQLRESGSLLKAFDNAQIESRRFARPLEWYLQPHSFAERNEVYVEVALDLGERLARAALRDADLTPADVDAVIFVSSTGVSTPSLDAYLMQRLGINSAAARLPLWGLGCGGGAAGLARAADLVRAGYRNVLLVAVELCSLTFVLGDADKSNIIGTALFADGGAAAVLGADTGDGGLVRLLHAHSTLIDDSAELTGWDVTEAGFKLRLSPEIPKVMTTQLRPAVDASLAAAGWSLDSISHVVVHPGGAKVILGYEFALGLPSGALASTREVLRRHGNMSSPTVLFVLAEELRSAPRGRGLISATGPGFMAEHLLVEFPGAGD